MAPPTPVVALGAFCELVEDSLDRDSSVQSFRVAEYAIVGSGERIMLHDGERGFTVRASHGPIVTSVSGAAIVRHVLNAVLPDRDDEGPHPLPWLADLLSARGVATTAGALEGLPYEVSFGPRLVDWLMDGDPP
jgi:hypothetical protein